MQEGDEGQNLNQNLIEGTGGSYPEINNISEVPNSNIEQMSPNPDNYGTSSNAVYENQPQLVDQITTKLSLSDAIKMEYEKAIFSDFEKIIQYNSFTNEFIPGLDNYLSYPYHFNPTLLSLTRYRKCDCCCSLKDACFNLCCKNFICERILFYFQIVFSVSSIFSLLTLFNLVLFIKALVFFFLRTWGQFYICFNNIYNYFII